MKYIVIFFSFFFTAVFHIAIYSQTATNFEHVDSLLNESVKKIIPDIDSRNSYSLTFFGSGDYSVLEERLKYHLRKDGVAVAEDPQANNKIFYTLTEARTDYSEIFQDGLFGDYLIERLVSLNSTYYIENNGEADEQKDLSLSIKDTVTFSDFSKIENVAYPFTSSELPEEPLFSSTLEPIIAIGTAAVAVYLFFNIRSK